MPESSTPTVQPRPVIAPQPIRTPPESPLTICAPVGRAGWN